MRYVHTGLSWLHITCYYFVQLLQVHPAAQALGDFDTSFRFTFSKRKDRLLKVTDIPTESENGWRFTLCNTDAVRTMDILLFLK